MKRQSYLVKNPTNTRERSSETELINLPERDFKIVIINMLMEVKKNIQELRNEFRMETQSLWNKMEIFKDRLDMLEEMINEIEIRADEYKEPETQREKRISRNENIINTTNAERATGKKAGPDCI